MKSLNYWQQFTHTGKIDDYLAYAKQENREREEVKALDAGVRQHAGIYMCNRNDSKTDACR